MVEKRFQKISEPSLESQESNKTNRVQFRLRMTKNQHKQCKLPKLPFQQTESNEPDGLVSQPVQPVERGSQNFSEPSSKSQKSNKTNQVENQLRMTENQHKRRQRPELLFHQTEFSEPANMVSQPVQPVERDSQICQNLPQRVRKTKKKQTK